MSAVEWAKPGSRCVCISPRPVWVRLNRTFIQRMLPFLACRDGPKFREVVTILAADEGFLMFVEYGVDDAYPARAFRPLITRTAEQDAELFAPLLGTKSDRDLVQ